MVKLIKDICSQYESKTDLPCNYYPVSTSDSFIRDTEWSVCADCRSKNMKNCEECRRRRKHSLRKCLLDKIWVLYFCPNGIFEWLSPLIEDDVVVGFLSSGGVLMDDSKISESDMKLFDSNNIEYFSYDYDQKPDRFDSTVKTMKARDVMSCCKMLYDLSRSYNTAVQSLSGIKSFDISDVYLTSAGELTADYDNQDDFVNGNARPLSAYICNTLSNPKALGSFWKSLEHSTSSIMPNLYVGRVDEARVEFNKILQFISSENDLEDAKISAEYITYIILLKFFNKEMYDTRYYTLHYQIVKKLFAATTKSEVISILKEFFDEARSMFIVPVNNPGKMAAVAKIMDYIDSNYDRPITIDEIVKSTYLSKAYASRLFKERSSISIKSYLTSRRMIQAYKLLIQTKMSVNEISKRVGYTDIRSFYKTFANYYGTTCTSIRKSSETLSGALRK